MRNFALYIALLLSFCGQGISQDASVILISVDGLRPDAITTLGPKKLKNFYRLMQEGAYTLNARTAVDYTITLPNHTGMITSRLVSGPKGHNWVVNKDPEPGDTIHNNKGEYMDSMFSVAHDFGLSTALFASKTKFSLFDVSYDSEHGSPDLTGVDNGADKIDLFEQKNLSEPVVDKLERTIKDRRFNLLMLHIRNPDTAGHAMSWTTKKPSFYLKAVLRSDEMIGDVLEHIDEEPGWAGNTYIVLTADHGGLTGAKSHSAHKERENFTIPFIVWGPGVKSNSDLYALNPLSRKDPGILNPPLTTNGSQPIRNADAGNLCLDLLGLPPIPNSTVNARQDLKVK